MTTPAVTYDIERRLGSSGTPSIVATGVSGLSYDASGLQPSTQYGWRVRRTGETTWSNLALATTAAATTPTDPTVPAPLTGTVGTVTSRTMGATTGTTMTLALKTAGCTKTRAYVTTSSAMSGTRIYSTTGTPDTNGLSKVTFTGLTADTQYYGRIEAGPAVDNAAPFQFRTFATAAKSFRFTFASCWRHTLASPAAFTAMEGKNPAFFIHTGDLHYYDIGTNDQSLFRTAWATALANSGTKSFLSKTAWDYVWSDHDFGPNNAFSTSASKPAAQAVYRQYMPHYSLPDAGGAIYHTFVYGRVRFIVLDLRTYKVNHANTDNSSKTILGTTQKQWLKDTISAATEAAIVLVSDVPWNYKTTAGEDSWGGYGTERTEIINHIASTGKSNRIVVITGDMHGLAADNGTNAPGGYAVFQAAPLDQGTSIKGGPWSHGVYVGGSTGTRIQAYGQCDVTDTGGSSISLAFTGFTADGTSRISLTKTISTTSAPPPPPPPPDGTGFIINMTGDQIRARPSSGAAFTNVKAQADSSFSPDLNTNSSVNGSKAFAAGLMYQFYKNSNPTAATTYRNKVISGWDTIMGMSSIHIQGLFRQMPGWVLAADLCEYKPANLITWLSAVRTKTASSSMPSVGAEGRWVHGLTNMAKDSANNHGILAIFALATINRFIGDTAGVDLAVQLLKGYIGMSGGWPRNAAGAPYLASPTGFTFSAGEPYSRTWTTNNGAAGWYPLGPSANLVSGTPLQKDGVIVDDISRDGKGYTLDSQGRPQPGGSGIQYTNVAAAGFMGAAYVLEGVVGAGIWQWQDSAFRRWLDWMHRYGPWDDGRVSTSYAYHHQGTTGWLESLVNKKYGTTWNSISQQTTGYSISYFDWLL